MKNLRKYGNPPFNVALLHGGPGAPGEMAPVARELSKTMGVLEPLQTADTVDGQVEELQGVLEALADLPVTLVGFSWGAWLGYIFAARHPKMVVKLVLVSSGPFKEEYARDIKATRLSRLSPKEKREVAGLVITRNSKSVAERNAALSRFGELMCSADAFDPLPDNSEPVQCDSNVHRGVWAQASMMRSSGELLKLGKKIKCPVIAIHGDYDSHPADGVRVPLESNLKDFRFIILKKCGHYPWYERLARDEFFSILAEELK